MSNVFRPARAEDATASGATGRASVHAQLDDPFPSRAERAQAIFSMAEILKFGSIAQRRPEAGGTSAGDHPLKVMFGAIFLQFPQVVDDFTDILGGDAVDEGELQPHNRLPPPPSPPPPPPRAMRR